MTLCPKPWAFLPGALLLITSLLSASCGRKEPPRLPVYEKPAKPSGLSVIHRENALHLRWSYSGDRDILEGFSIMRAVGADFKQAGFEKEPRFVDANVEPGLTYRYAIVANSVQGVLGDRSEEVMVTPSIVPQPPSGLTFSVRADSISLSWRHQDVGALFNVYKASEKGKYQMRPLNSAPLSVMSFGDSIDTHSNVYYTVRALRGSPLRDESAPSGEIAITPADYVPSKPVGFRAVLTDEGRTLLIWKENPESWVRGYRVYRASAGGEFALAGEPQTPAFEDTEGVGLRRYIVRAIGPAAEGPASDEISVP